jgi:hypothetical protein
MKFIQDGTNDRCFDAEDDDVRMLHRFFIVRGDIDAVLGGQFLKFFDPRSAGVDLLCAGQFGIENTADERGSHIPCTDDRDRFIQHCFLNSFDPSTHSPRWNSICSEGRLWWWLI